MSEVGTPIVLTREEFTEMYGPHPDWMWDMLVRNYEKLKEEGKV